MIRWGVLGFGRIAKRFIKGLSYSQNGKLYAVASKGGQTLSELTADVKVYRDYESLINDPDVDAIYIALRHQDHYHWAKQALLHHKSVLCEKPATLSYLQTKELCELSQKENVFFMEAMKARFIPLIDDIKTLIHEKKLGEIQTLSTSFCGAVHYQEGHYLFEKTQGGALYDVGIYNIECVLDLMEAMPNDIHVYSEKKYGVDVYDKIELIYLSTKAILEMAIDRNEEKALMIQGTKATLYATPFYRPTLATIIYADGAKECIQKEYQYDDFYGEIEEVHRCIQKGQYQSERMSHADTLNAIKLIEKIKENENW